jgi:peptidoglycan/LPS O-acetylase OafA/YrhL
MLNKNYRADIDGLRAISILLVVLFHFFPDSVPGGFVGVDVFFVISGYLITGILLDSLKRNTFSLFDFYKRRALRIFPALSLVFIVFIIFGWGCLFPDEFKNLGKHVVGGSLFVSNIVLWRESGYFDAAAELKPFLNLWSLGIEEQFYIVWPLLLAFVWKKSLNIKYVLSFLVIVSFGLNIWMIKQDPVAVFYLPMTRVWELGIGALLPVFISSSHSSMIMTMTNYVQRWKTLFSALGMFLIVFIAFYLTKHDLYPKYWGLFPTIGAFLLIALGPDTWVHRKILSHPLLVGIGLTSYPLYLWHWPMISFAHILHPAGVPILTKVVLLAGSIVLSIGTYYLIERPIRFGSQKTLKAIVLTILMAGIGLTGWYIYKSYLIPYNTEDLESIQKDWHFPGKLKVAKFNENGFYILKNDSEKETVYFGDSNIQQYSPRIEKILEEHPERYNSASFHAGGGCGPIPNVMEDKHPNCKDLVKKFKDYTAAHPNVDTIVIGASWIFLKERSYYYEEQGKKYPLLGSGDGYNKAIRALGEMISELIAQEKKVYLILNIPRGPSIDPTVFIKRNNFFSDLIIKRQDEKKQYYANQEDSTSELYSITQDLIKVGLKNGAEIINPVDFLCNGGKCSLFSKEGAALYKDIAHLTGSGCRTDATFIDKTLLKR